MVAPLLSTVLSAGVPVAWPTAGPQSRSCPAASPCSSFPLLHRGMSAKGKWLSAVDSRRCNVNSNGSTAASNVLPSLPPSLRKERTFHSNAEIFPGAWGFAGRCHDQVLLCLCSPGLLNRDGISVIITFDWRWDKSKHRSSTGANCISPWNEEGQLRKFFSVNWLNTPLFLLTSHDSALCG